MNSQNTRGALTIATEALRRLADVPGCGCAFPCRCGGAEWTKAELEGRMDVAAEALREIDRLATPPSAPSPTVAPDGWKLVPVEPIEAMAKAYLNPSMTSWRQRYIAMLAAAPVAETSPTVAGLTDEAALRVALEIMEKLDDRSGVLDDVDDETRQEIADEIAVTIKTRAFPADSESADAIRNAWEGGQALQRAIDRLPSDSAETRECTCGGGALPGSHSRTCQMFDESKMRYDPFGLNAEAPTADALSKAKADQAADRHYRAGFLAGWNSGVEGDTAKLKGVQERVGNLADYLRAAPAATRARGAVTDEQREKVRDAIAEALGSAYDCLRVWSAWGVGTMGPDDFALVAEDDDRLNEITDAAITALAAPAQPINIDAAARMLAECMDYPWEHMPYQGRREMEKHARRVIDAGMSKGGA